MIGKKALCLALLVGSASGYADTTCIESPELPHEYTQSMDTIGDSITAALDGAKMRCIFKANGLNMDYVGQFLDPYGYRHDGRDADTTVKVIERLGQTPRSDNYFMLIGVNDKLLLNLTAEQTVANIEKIAEQLYAKNPQAKIYVSTLLPTVREDLNTQNNKINAILRTKLNCKNCVLVDTGEMFRSIKDWPSYTFDGVHPKASGYEKIAKFVVPIINKNKINA